MGHRLAVYVALRRDDEVLFLLRSGTGYRDGEYGLPAGKVEDGETVVAAARRELAEEVGAAAADADLVLRHVMERITPTGSWIDWFFECRSWTGEPANREPEKSAGIAWLAPTDPRVSDYVRTALTADPGSFFSSHEGE